MGACAWWLPSRFHDPAVQLRPSEQMLSLMPMGTPCSLLKLQLGMHAARSRSFSSASVSTAGSISSTLFVAYATCTSIHVWMKD